VNVFYIARRLRNADEAHKVVSALLAASNVCPLHQAMLQTALTLPMRDYEDAVQCATADVCSLDAIITRDPRDYAAAPLPVFSPEDFLSQLRTADS
jgi:hypothetical protein